MIHYVKGDVTDAQQQVIAHGCNCSGGFGSGVAGAIKRKYPAVREAYLQHESKQLGSCQFVEHAGRVWVNAFTQESYGYDGKQYANLEAITLCLEEVKQYMKMHGYETVAMPKIGCGLGGLTWEQVGPVVEDLAKHVNVYVYEL